MKTFKVGDEVVLKARVAYVRAWRGELAEQVVTLDFPGCHDSDPVEFSNRRLAAMQPVDATPPDPTGGFDILGRPGWEKLGSGYEGHSYYFKHGPYETWAANVWYHVEEGWRVNHPTKGWTNVSSLEEGCLAIERAWAERNPPKPPFAVGDHVGHRHDPGDGGALVLSIDGDDLRVRFIDGSDYNTRQSVQKYVKCSDQAACRRAFAIARVERAQEKVRKFRDALPGLVGRPDGFRGLNAVAQVKDLQDARALLRDCFAPAHEFVSYDGTYIDSWGTHLINLAERLG